MAHVDAQAGQRDELEADGPVTAVNLLPEWGGDADALIGSQLQAAIDFDEKRLCAVGGTHHAQARSKVRQQQRLLTAGAGQDQAGASGRLGLTGQGEQGRAGDAAHEQPGAFLCHAYLRAARLRATLAAWRACGLSCRQFGPLRSRRG